MKVSNNTIIEYPLQSFSFSNLELTIQSQTERILNTDLRQKPSKGRVGNKKGKRWSKDTLMDLKRSESLNYETVTDQKSEIWEVRKWSDDLLSLK